MKAASLLLVLLVFIVSACKVEAMAMEQSHSQSSKELPAKKKSSKI